jgi:hypothetical protein
MMMMASAIGPSAGPVLILVKVLVLVPYYRKVALELLVLLLVLLVQYVLYCAVPMAAVVITDDSVTLRGCCHRVAVTVSQY